MSQHFVGEIELISDQPNQAAFPGFENLPHRNFILHLAQKHKDAVELMPYQKEGDSVKLLVSVYLKMPEQDGRIIVVLLRENYPSDLESLRLMVETARTRLRTAAVLKQQFDSDTIDLADRELEQILQEVGCLQYQPR